MEDAQSSATDYACGPPRRHHSLYFEDGTLVMQVENAVFKIQRSLLARYSTVLRDMLSVPSVEGNKDGTDERPLVMSGDSAASWELLLGLQYDITRNRPGALKGEEMLTILPIAHKYCMDEIEVWIVEQLKVTSSYDGLVDLIVASRIVDSDELYQDGLQRLLSTKSSPTLHQAKRMGVEVTYAIMKAAADAAIANVTSDLEAKHSKALAAVVNPKCRNCHGQNWFCGNCSHGM
ncbi:hypothetical protein FRC14_002085 [Serendipita sp. 396]|nr:hypothetical protein FRC14_002085 [Serendipita sp. 396]KAG8777688.1 hypothetical protein FRC15_011173 [Serendipita sp. 397]KAG8862864.1 hypothetical protein FRC20_011010 [Serendipita sp. 405]KAG9044996.1 hypothetical protein FS842_001292 [Serendipita sp. 407]